MINDNYLNGLAKLMIGEAYNIPSYNVYGSITGVITANDTETSGEFDRDALTYDRAGNIAKLVGLRSSAAANNEVINVTSFANSGIANGTNDIQVNFLISSLIHTTSFDVEIEGWIKHERG